MDYVQHSDRVVLFHWDYAWISVSIALITTTVAALFATIHELRETPASLMQPKAPKPESDFFGENHAPWSKTSFIVTFRNIFRYKQRFYMTVLGIAGCTAS